MRELGNQFRVDVSYQPKGTSTGDKSMNVFTLCLRVFVVKRIEIC